MKYHSFFSRTGFSAFLLPILILQLIALQASPPALAAPQTPDGHQALGEAFVNANLLSAENTIRFPANALNFDKASTILTQSGYGIRWQSNFAAGAMLTVPRPLDWDEESDVTLSLYFYPTSSVVGNVQFFIRPRAFNHGDILADTSDLSSDAVAVSVVNQVRKQVITIPAARFGTKELWAITIQREGSLETYDGDVVLMSVGLSYTRQLSSPSSAAFTLPANALNFNKDSAITAQSGYGILWQANYAQGALLTVPRPLDWDGVSDVTLSLYFFPTSSASGNMQFFIRPRAFNHGDIFADADSLMSEVVAVSTMNQVRKQAITIPADRFGAKELWAITIQRDGALETYTGDVVLMSVGLSYTRQPPSNFGASYNLPANALNFDKAGTILTQSGNGILWQADATGGAFLIVPRPLDWDEESDVTLSLYFYPRTSASGNMQFFARPRAFNHGDIFADATGITSDVLAVSATEQVRKQVITIPAARFGAKELWVITIQRDGPLETYTGEVVLVSVGLSYTQPFQRVFLPVISR